MAIPNNTYIALLRGINVGGNSLIKMVDLKACFEEMKLNDVVTYIQSGNVVFKSPETDQEKLITTIEDALFKKFSIKIRVVVVTQKQLVNIVNKSPKDFGSEPALYRYDVIFLKKPLIPKEAIKSFSVKEGVDAVYTGIDVIYFSRLIEKAAQSRLPRIISLPIYKEMTIRNWNTTTRLLALTEKKL